MIVNLDQDTRRLLALALRRLRDRARLSLEHLAEDLIDSSVDANPEYLASLENGSQTWISRSVLNELALRLVYVRGRTSAAPSMMKHVADLPVAELIRDFLHAAGSTGQLALTYERTSGVADSPHGVQRPVSKHTPASPQSGICPLGSQDPGTCPGKEPLSEEMDMPSHQLVEAESMDSGLAQLAARVETGTAESDRSAPDAKLMEDCARSLIRRSGLIGPPFVPDILAPLQQIRRIIRTNLGELDGLLITIDNGYIVKLNALQHPFRQNFSCAHEIAHTFLLDNQAGGTPARTRTTVGERRRRVDEETLCNIGAREILMPEALFSGYAQEYGFSPQALAPLARTFGTSITATARRLVEISPDPLIAIFWTFRNTPTSSIRKLRVAWSIKSASARRHARYFVPELASIGSGSSVAHAYSSDEFASKGEDLRLGNLKGRYHVESKGFGHGPHRTVIIRPPQSLKTLDKGCC